MVAVKLSGVGRKSSVTVTPYNSGGHADCRLPKTITQQTRDGEPMLV